MKYVNPNCPACALCPLWEVCTEDNQDSEIPDELISQAEAACGM